MCLPKTKQRSNGAQNTGSSEHLSSTNLRDPPHQSAYVSSSASQASHKALLDELKDSGLLEAYDIAVGLLENAHSTHIDNAGDDHDELYT